MTGVSKHCKLKTYKKKKEIWLAQNYFKIDFISSNNNIHLKSSHCHLNQVLNKTCKRKHCGGISSCAASDKEQFCWQPVGPSLAVALGRTTLTPASRRQQEHSHHQRDVVLSAGSDQITAGGRENKEARASQSDLVSHATSRSPATEAATQRRPRWVETSRRPTSRGWRSQNTSVCLCLTMD